uniref:Uncharacterized protein n=1 Tax=Cannabis sativa TaxID=3483 RepID=A0A803QGC1_CANSA
MNRSTATKKFLEELCSCSSTIEMKNCLEALMSETPLFQYDCDEEPIYPQVHERCPLGERDDVVSRFVDGSVQQHVEHDGIIREARCSPKTEGNEFWASLCS